jgi:serine/threonine protein kinase/Flp pilus assembly protein TadD
MQGRTLGHYQIVEPLGAGGMGEVYRAHDTILKRDVAIKVLPENLAGDPERLSRLEREAQLLASLNHPGIATIHGLEESVGVRFLVLELVEGETLSERLRRGRLDLELSHEIARQIAEALEAAHQKSVVHRDLKPANVKITPEGRVKILDFGLAKVFRAEGEEAEDGAEAGGAAGASLDIAESPTVAAATLPGVILGTPAYMCPEQARGQTVDKRADIWAFGCLLYEMLAGRRPFDGETVTDILAALIERDPEWDALPESAPGRIRDLLRKCLEKDPSRRLHDIADARIEIEDARAELAQAPGPWAPREPARPAEMGRHPEAEPGPDTGKINSIAVLPLQNLSGDVGQEYFSEGMTDALITDLAKIGALKVISRTSAMRYRDTDKSLPQIARELSVDAVVEGSVLRAGERVRITAQLIHAATDQHLWAESYDRDLGDILSLQSEVARAVAREIQVKVTPQEDALLARARRVDPGAQEAYLRGLHYWNKTTKSRFTDAMEHFRLAIERDPSHAQAYAGLADSYWWSAFWGNQRPHKAYPRAREAVERALALDETLGEAHASLGSIHLMYDWDWAAAGREFRRALELAPNSSSARICHSFYLTLMRRQDEAIAETKRAQALDPLSGFSNSHLGHQFWHGRRYDEAIETFEKWLLIEPDDWFAHSHLGLQYQAKGKTAEAIAAVDKGVELSGGVAVCISNAALVHYRSGDRQVADRLFKSLIQRAAHEYVQPMTFIAIHRARGETDQAFEWVKKAYEERDSFLPWLRVTPFDSFELPSDPRIDELLDRLGLP